MGKQQRGVTRLGPGRYHIRVSVVDPRTGKQRERKKTVQAPNAAAAAAMRAQLRESALREVDAAPRTTVADFAESWLKKKRAEVAPSTLNTYAAALDQLGWLGDIYVDMVVPADVIKWRDEMCGKAATVNGYLRVVKTVFADATADLRLGHNPAERVRGKRAKKIADEEESNRLTAGELARVLEQSAEIVPQWHALFATLALTGARWGAVSALRWRDVDLDEQQIAFERAQWRGELKELKAGKQRSVPISPLLSDALRDHRRLLLEKQNHAQLASGLVFPSRNGNLLHNGGGVAKPWKAVLTAAGVERRVAIHGLRRTFNNLARQVSSKLVTQAMTGHVTDEMTDHYSFVEADEKRRAVAGITELISSDGALKTVPKAVLPGKPLDDGDPNNQ